MANNRATRRLAKFGHFSENRVFYLDTVIPDLSVGRDINDAEAETWGSVNALDLSVYDLVWWEVPQCVHYGRCDHDTRFEIVEITLADL